MRGYYGPSDINQKAKFNYNLNLPTLCGLTDDANGQRADEMDVSRRRRTASSWGLTSSGPQRTKSPHGLPRSMKNRHFTKKRLMLIGNPKQSHGHITDLGYKFGSKETITKNIEDKAACKIFLPPAQHNSTHVHPCTQRPTRRPRPLLLVAGPEPTFRSITLYKFFRLNKVGIQAAQCAQNLTIASPTKLVGIQVRVRKLPWYLS